jgi:lipoate-protein ligase A
MENFKFIYSDIVDPYFNIASEEYLLKQTNGYYIYIWKNSPAVIIGNNQNTLLEVDVNTANKEGIKVVRRLTGGGAVYHDLNNVCYTIIAPFNSEENNYIKFTKPVIEYLNSLGVNATFAGRNDILVDGRKISGNAQVIYKDRIMHHGTILFDTDGSELEKCLNPSKIKMQSKGIKSVRARVANVKDYLTEDMTMSEFKTGLVKKLSKTCIPFTFSNEQIEQIKKLVDEKYSRYEWNIGRSPKGQNTFEKKFDFGIFCLNFDTEQGKIYNANVSGDFFELKSIKEFCQKLNGLPFGKSSLTEVFSCLSEFIQGADGNAVLDAMFC